MLRYQLSNDAIYLIVVDTPAHLSVHLNRSLADRYEFVREAGAYGMTTVFLSRLGYQ